VLGKLGLILKWVILLPVLLGVVLLAVANVQSVPLHLNAFSPDDPVLTFNLPLYQLAFLLFLLGAILGGLVAWGGQRKYRRRAHQRREEAARWQDRAERSERQQSEARAPSPVAGFLPRPERG
jgi:uncharacterized integral membrane protein